MSKPYDQPTDDLRQVKRPIKRGNGVCGPGWHEETIGYDTTIQRKWFVASTKPRSIRFDEVAPDCWVESDGKGNWWAYDRIVEWRDLDTVWTEKPRMRAL